MILFESLIERDYIYLLDFDQDVVSFAEQPFAIEYRHLDRTLRYTPDFHVTLAGGRQVVAECKPLCFVDTDENKRKFAAARTWCAERAWSFTVVTGEELRAGHRLENVKLLTYYARRQVPPQIAARVYATLDSARDAFTVGDMARALSPDRPQAALPAIWHMAYHHTVSLPLDPAPISMQCALRLPSRTAARQETA